MHFPCQRTFIIECGVEIGKNFVSRSINFVISTNGNNNQIRLKSQLLSPYYGFKEGLKLTPCTATLDYELLSIDRFTMKTHILDGNQLTIPEVFDLANETAHAKLSSTAKRKILRARKLVEQWTNNGEVVYGVTTGFGEFANMRVKAEDIEQLQENLIFSHAAGAGDPLPEEVVRAMMALRINALAKGFSGIRLSTVELLMEMLNRDIIPVIPSQGSVGASGDLVQLAHLVLAMMGKGKINQKEKGKRRKYTLVDSSVSTSEEWTATGTADCKGRACAHQWYTNDDGVRCTGGSSSEPVSKDCRHCRFD